MPPACRPVIPRLPFLVPLAALAATLVLAVAPARAATYRCTVQGTVTFQQSPCAAEGPSRGPTVEELNAEEKRRRAARAASAPASGRALAQAGLIPAGAPPAAAGFRCDGRTRCSQMHSCAEARYFLSHCPGVQMDGNHDGVPCEKQWCGH